MLERTIIVECNERDRIAPKLLVVLLPGCLPCQSVVEIEIPVMFRLLNLLAETALSLRLMDAEANSHLPDFLKARIS